jgi:hypothetical protein
MVNKWRPPGRIHQAGFRSSNLFDFGELYFSILGADLT